ncbi:MAG: nucleotidyl transferase AbiEii/AbiGii toxin family protein, partial [Candidatus Curtissbacteria bacterium]|nr:nucleotidyl transferase AbiEii/AbiGii toxin family protein [Candidatus Curtissbacteria bacterium]
NVISVTEKQLVFEKLHALLERGKPRDFYDLYFLLRARLPMPQKKEVFPKVLAALKEKDMNFEAELKQYLPKSHWAIIRDFKTNLEREINRFI